MFAFLLWRTISVFSSTIHTATHKLALTRRMALTGDNFVGRSRQSASISFPAWRRDKFRSTTARRPLLIAQQCWLTKWYLLPLMLPMALTGKAFASVQKVDGADDAPMPLTVGKSDLPQKTASPLPPANTASFAAFGAPPGQSETLQLISTELTHFSTGSGPGKQRVSMDSNAATSPARDPSNEGFSARLNLSAIIEEGEFAYQGDKDTFQSALVVAEPSLQFGTLGNAVLEGRFVARFNQDQSESLSGSTSETSSLAYRDYTRLVVDFPEKPFRIEVGDIFVASSRLQRSPSILGLSLSSAQNELMPLRSAYGTGVQSFALARDSTVEVTVNGVQRSQLYLKAGEYDLRDIPLNFGANDVQLLVRDNTGSRQRIDLSLYGAPQLLRAGEISFALAAGVQSVRTTEGLDYFTDRAVVYGSAAMGITGNAQMGASLLGVNQNYSSSLNGRAIGWFGEYAGEILVQTGQDVIDAMAVQASYRSAAVGHIPPVRFSGSYFGAGFDAYEAVTEFSRPVSRSLLNPFRIERLWQADASMTFDVASDYAVDFGIDLVKFRDTDDAVYDRPEWSTYGSVYGPLGDKSLLALTLTLGQFEEDKLEAGAFISITRRFGGNKNVALKHNTQNDRTRLTVGRTSKRFTNDWNGNIGVEQSKDFDDLENNIVADFELETDRFDFYAETSAPSNIGATEVRQRYSVAEISTSIGYSGGSAAWGRSSTGPFALIEADDSLSGNILATDYDGEDYTSRAAAGQRALFGGLLPYRDQTVRITALDDAGDETCEAVVSLVPSNKSGRKIVVTREENKASKVTAGAILAHCISLEQSTADERPGALSDGRASENQDDGEPSK